MVGNNHISISNNSDEQQQELKTSVQRGFYVQTHDSSQLKFKIQIIVYSLVIFCLICARFYIRIILYQETLEQEKNIYKLYVEQSENLTKIVLHDLPQSYANQINGVKYQNQELSELYNILNNNQLNSQSPQKTSKPQQQIDINELKQDTNKLDHKNINKNNQNAQFENVDGFKPIAGISVERMIAAKKTRKLINQPLDSQSQIALEEFQYYEQTYQISKYEEKPFCIVIPTYNNQNNERYKKNINSVIQQNYKNYHIVIIQDASTDKTGKLIDEYIDQIIQKYPTYNFQNRIKVIHNEVSQRAMPNLRKAALQYCQAYQIFLIVDGDDELIGRQVLKLFNSQFQQKKIWFMYTNSITHIGSLGFSRPLRGDVKQSNHYRKSAFVTSHLRAYYTQLFRLIKEKDLQNEKGEFFRAANDVAICIPILQMCHQRVAYVPQITYLYNSNTGYNNHRIRLKQQSQNNRKIRQYPSYQPLQQLFP